MKARSLGWLLASVGLMSTPNHAVASVIWLEASFTGVWQQDGSADGFVSGAGPGANYAVGRGSATPPSIPYERRVYFVFDLSGFAGIATGAELALYLPRQGYVSNDPYEVFTLFDVTSPINASGELEGTGSQQFDDIGSGIVYGSRTITSADNYSFILITLNSNALAAISASSGLFAIGGSITTLDFIEGVSEEEYVFGYTGGPPLPGISIATDGDDIPPAYAPEPTYLALLGLGLAGLGLSRRRRTE